jgi:hypothetical protein
MSNTIDQEDPRAHMPDPEPPDAEIVDAPTMAVGRHDPRNAAPPQQMTAAQAKVDAVAALTMSAYAKASELKLTPEESAALSADFPDEAFRPGAAGKENLLYIEHAFLRDRLHQVFGPGQWAIVPRNRWAEAFKTRDNKDGSRVYVEAMLMVRGCFVGEAVGEMEYYPHNAAQNYGDAVEGAKTAAFRRCAKEFGIGLQAWKKDWCEGWWQRNRTGRVQRQSEGGGTSGAPEQRPVPQPSSTATKPAAHAQGKVATPPSSPTPSPKPGLDAGKAAGWKAYLLSETRKADVEIWAWAVAQSLDWLMPNEKLEAVSAIKVPQNKAAFEKYWAQVLNAKEIGVNQMLQEAYELAYGPIGMPPADDQVPGAEMPPKPIEVKREGPPAGTGEEWRTFPMPYGKNAGVILEELDKKYLYGLWANFEVETEYNGKPKRPETVAKDTKFRELLDDAGEHYDFQKND